VSGGTRALERATSSSVSGMRPSKQESGCATSPPPSSSRRCSGDSPTTPSARSSSRSSGPRSFIVDELGFAPLDDAGAQLLFRFVAGAYERVSVGIGSHWPFDQWGRFLPEHTTAVSMLDRLLHHGVVVVTDGESFRMREARQRSAGAKSPRGAPPTKTTTKEVRQNI